MEEGEGGVLTEVRLHQSNSTKIISQLPENLKVLSRRTGGFIIFFSPFSFLSAKSQQAVEQQGQAADNQIRHLVSLLQTTAGTSLSLLTGV